MTKEKLKFNIRIPQKQGNSMKRNWVRLYLLGDIDHLEANVYVIFNQIPSNTYTKKTLQLEPRNALSYYIYCDFPVATIDDPNLLNIQSDCFIESLTLASAYNLKSIIFSSICASEVFTDNLYRSLHHYNYHTLNSIEQITIFCDNADIYMNHCSTVNLLYSLNKIY